MKAAQHVFAVTFGVFLLFALTHCPVYANVYAGQVALANEDGTVPFDGSFGDGSGALISFYLNDAATSIAIDIVDVESQVSVFQILDLKVERGFQSYIWAGSGSEPNKDYVAVVTATGDNYSNTDWTMFWDSGDVDIFTRGVAVVTDQSDSRFGRIYTSNDGGPLGTGINIFNTDGTFHDPFLVAADVANGGEITYGSDAPIFAVLDAEGRLYVSLLQLGQVMRINPDYSTDVVIGGLTAPKGLYAEGSGDDLSLYVVADQQVWRADIGSADTIATGDLVQLGNFSDFYPHQLTLDDDGAMYLTLRQSNDLGSDGRGIRKYNISGTLPVTDADALWFMGEDRTFIANDLLLDSGDDLNSSTDDILYYCTRAGSGNDQDGIWRIDNINGFFPDTVRIITEDALYGADDNINARATMDFDGAGNIVLMENSNEHVFFITPPGEGLTNSYVTTSATSIHVDVPAGIEDEDGRLPLDYRLEANFPNPFNPTTHFGFQIADFGLVNLSVYNIQGQLVKTVVNREMIPGRHTASWDGTDQAGRRVASGTYIYSLRAGEFREARRMTLTK